MTTTKGWNIEEILAILYSKSLNTSTLINLISTTGSFKEAVTSKKLINQDMLFGSNYNEFMSLAKKQIELCSKNDINIVSFWDDSYPLLLKQIAVPPICLYTRGELKNNDAFAISIVGTRQNTLYGRLSAEKFADFFARRNTIIISGLANGIDTISHNATLKADGITYAVIASGIDRISPSLSAKKSDEIVNKGGCIISEYPCGIVAKPGYFPQRNRIISGISKATIIIESGEKGGSLITAKFAFDQQREVFAVPGNINSQKSIGTNFLIKKNIASIAISPEQVFNELGLDVQSIPGISQTANIKFNNPEEELLYNLLSYEPLHIDEIAEKSGLDAPEVVVKLLELEFRDIIRKMPGANYIKV